MKTLHTSDTNIFQLKKDGKPYNLTGKVFIVKVEQYWEDRQIEIMEDIQNPTTGEIKFQIDDDIKWDCEICIKEFDGEEQRTVFEDTFKIK